MSYTYDISTDRGKVRMYLGDAYGVESDSTTYTFEDDEIDVFLSIGGSVNGGVVEGLRVLLVDKARRAKSFVLKGLSMNDTAALAALRDMLDVFGGGMPTADVIMPALIPSDSGYDESNP